MRKQLTGYLLFLLGNFIVLDSEAQLKVKDSIPATSKYIEQIKDYLTIRAALNNDVRGFGVHNDRPYTILPNKNNIIRLSSSYRWASFSSSFTPAFIPGNNDDESRGHTNSLSFSANLNFTHWMQQLSYARVKGYYLGNTSDFVPGWQPGDSYIQFPDLVHRAYSGRTSYKFNSNFSFNALNTQTERQLRSAGTFIPSLLYEYYIMDDRTPLNEQNTTQKSRNLEVILSAGYIHNFVIDRAFYISAGAFPGFGFIRTALTTRQLDQSRKDRYVNPLFRLETGGEIGYNGKRFFAGTQFNISAEAYNERKTPNVNVNDRVIYQVFLGYRFNAPTGLKERMDMLDQKMATLLIAREEKKKSRKAK